MKTAVIGAGGQLGSDLCPLLAGEVVKLSRPQFDLTDSKSVALLESIRPDVVINCAAYNFVDRAESEPEAAFAVNTHGVCRLAQRCQQLGCLLVHFSTDYVFGQDDERAIPYTESDAPGPVSVYGNSKLAGGYFVRSQCEKHFVIRTGGLYGHHGVGGKGKNFVETMLRLAQSGKPIRVVNDQICTPTATADLAPAVVDLIKTESYGLYHLTNSGACSWYEFARTIFETAKRKADLTPVSSADFGAAARRPGYSVLESEKDSVLPPLRPWKEALATYLEHR